MKGRKIRDLGEKAGLIGPDAVGGGQRYLGAPSEGILRMTSRGTLSGQGLATGPRVQLTSRWCIPKYWLMRGRAGDAFLPRATQHRQGRDWLPGMALCSSILLR